MNFDRLASPESVGMNAGAVHELNRLVEQQIAEYLSPGVQVVVARHGQPVVDVALGVARRDPLTPVTYDTLFYSWSVAKPITALAVHLLIERGQLSLDDAIVKYWREFGKHGKDRVLVRHVLSHRAGFPISPESFPYYDFHDWDAAVRGMEDAELKFEPGSAVQYHALTFGWTLGELVRRVDGRRIEAFVRDEFFVPLRMCNTYLKLPDSLLARTVELVAAADYEDGVKGALLFNLPPLRTAVIPAAGLHTTARDMARFYQMLLNGGELDGARVLSAESIVRARTPSNLPNEVERDSGSPSHRSYGFDLAHHGARMWGDERVSATTFGHNGWATNATWADPERGVLCIILNNGMQNDIVNFERLRALSEQVLIACDT
ncbi:MAG: beta-lactamase family protein [Chloroflexi bacterium]|nr:beta-lactamase family protein [Chloroflexota bacterium]